MLQHGARQSARTVPMVPAYIFALHPEQLAVGLTGVGFQVAIYHVVSHVKMVEESVESTYPAVLYHAGVTDVRDVHI